MKNNQQKPGEALTVKSHTFKVGDIVTESYEETKIPNCQILEIYENGRVLLQGEMGQEWRSNLVWLKPREK